MNMCGDGWMDGWMGKQENDEPADGVSLSKQTKVVSSLLIISNDSFVFLALITLRKARDVGQWLISRG